MNKYLIAVVAVVAVTAALAQAPIQTFVVKETEKGQQPTYKWENLNGKYVRSTRPEVGEMVQSGIPCDCQAVLFEDDGKTYCSVALVSNLAKPGKVVAENRVTECRRQTQADFTPPKTPTASERAEAVATPVKP